MNYHPMLFEISCLVMQLGIWVLPTVNRAVCSATLEVDVSQICVRLGSSPDGKRQQSLFTSSLHLYLNAFISYHLPKMSAR